MAGGLGVSRGILEYPGISSLLALKRFKAGSGSRKLARKVFSIISPGYVCFLDMSVYPAIYRIQDNNRNQSQIF
jgi:hypothetical protein